MVIEQLPQLAGASIAIPYAVRCRTLRLRGTPVPVWRKLSFGAGVAVCVAAVLPPLGTIDDELLVAHMGQHVLLGDVGPLLIVLGLTGPLLAPVLRSPLGGLRRLGHPVLAYLLWALDLYAWHLAPLYEAAVRHAGVHALQHLMFVALGTNMWLALLGPLPKPAWFGNAARLLYVVAVRLTGTVLGNVFLWSGVAFYPVYRAQEARWGLAPVTDQGLAGGLMMLEESLVTLGLLSWLFLRAARESDERQVLLDRAHRAGVPLSEQRAGRAVAAGAGGLLAERIERDALAVGYRADPGSPEGPSQ